MCLREYSLERYFIQGEEISESYRVESVGVSNEEEDNWCLCGKETESGYLDNDTSQSKLMEEIDSVKTISTRAYTLDSLDTEIPVDEADINFYIGGMLSKMKICLNQ